MSELIKVMYTLDGEDSVEMIPAKGNDYAEECERAERIVRNMYPKAINIFVV